MTKEIKDTDFEMLPKADTMVAYKDKIILYDNIGKPLSGIITDEINSFITIMPKKIDFTAVILCTKGHIEIGCNMKMFSIGPGGLIVAVPGTICESIKIDPESEMIVIAVPDQDYAPDNTFHNATYAQKNFTAPVCLQLDEQVLKSGIDSYMQLKNTILTMGDKLNDDLIKAYIMVLAGLAAVNLQKWMIENPDDKLPAKELTVKRFFENIEKYYKEHRDVAFYAQLADMEPKYFARIISENTGKRPLEWIKQRVILDAKSMLKSREFSIAQVCETLHFPQRAHFNRYFKEATGQTPNDYLKK